MDQTATVMTSFPRISAWRSWRSWPSTTCARVPHPGSAFTKVSAQVQVSENRNCPPQINLAQLEDMAVNHVPEYYTPSKGKGKGLPAAAAAATPPHAGASGGCIARVVHSGDVALHPTPAAARAERAKIAADHPEPCAAAPLHVVGSSAAQLTSVRHQRLCFLCCQCRQIGEARGQQAGARHPHWRRRHGHAPWCARTSHLPGRQPVSVTPRRPQLKWRRQRRRSQRRWRLGGEAGVAEPLLFRV